MAFDPITAIAGVAQTVLSRVLPDKPAQEAATAELARMQLSGDLAAISGQLQVDAAEAASKSTFVAGWRPFIGWICGCALAYDFIVRPFLMFAATGFRSHAIAPEIDVANLNQLLFGMLGLATMRTVEKLKGSNSTGA